MSEATYKREKFRGKYYNVERINGKATKRTRWNIHNKIQNFIEARTTNFVHSITWEKQRRNKKGGASVSYAEIRIVMSPSDSVKHNTMEATERLAKRLMKDHLSKISWHDIIEFSEHHRFGESKTKGLTKNFNVGRTTDDKSIEVTISYDGQEDYLHQKANL